MIERPRRVVLLIDYDNLQICASRDTPGRELQLTPVVQLAQRFGTVIQARAYAEWNLSTERLAVYKAGIEPAFAPVLRTESDRSGKSLADTVMVAEGMDMLWTLSPDVVVLATSDKDLIPLVRVAKQRGAHVVVLGSDFTAIPLREMADDHFTYRQLITDPSGRIVGEPSSSRQPAALPDPSRRRSRERSGRVDRPTDRPTERPADRPADRPTDRPERSERPERIERVERPERPEREAQPAATAEPVAPVTSGTPADADAQSTGRRRRRRGSRRRTDRLGITTEGGTYAESAAGTGDESETDQPALEITPTTNILDVAEASGGTVESHSPNGSAAEVEAPTPEVAAPRERRRRTTRRTPAAESPPQPEVRPAAPNGMSAEAAEPERAGDGPAAGEAPGPIETPEATDGEGITSGPRPRARRVASAGRSRSRRA